MLWYFSYALHTIQLTIVPGGGGGGTPYNGLYRKAPPERGTFFSLQVYERVGILQVIIFRINAPEGCRSSFIKHYMKTRTRLPKIGM